MHTYSKGVFEEKAKSTKVPPADLKIDVRDVEDTFGSNNRAGVEVFAFDEDGKTWPVVTLIPGKRIRIHPTGMLLGLQCETGKHAGVKHV